MWSVHLWSSDIVCRWDTFEDTATKMIFSLEGGFASTWVTWMTWHFEGLKLMSQSFSHFSRLSRSFCRISELSFLSRARYIAVSDFIWDFGKLPFPFHLGKIFKDFGKMIPKIHKIGKIYAFFGLGMVPV